MEDAHIVYRKELHICHLCATTLVYKSSTLIKVMWLYIYIDIFFDIDTCK